MRCNERKRGEKVKVRKLNRERRKKGQYLYIS
jgi:hypothetical protein